MFVVESGACWLVDKVDCWTNEDGIVDKEVIGTGWLDDGRIEDIVLVVELVESFEEDKATNGEIYWA